MVKKMAQVVDMKQKLNIEERNMLSVACKKCIEPDRASWKMLSIIRQEEGVGWDDRNVTVFNWYKELVKKDISPICKLVLSMIDKHLIPKLSNWDHCAFVFCYKMLGDYHSYLAEIESGADKEMHTNEAKTAYKSAMRKAVMKLGRADPLRLDLALSYSVFCDEILGLRESARIAAKKAFKEASSGLSVLSEKAREDSTAILALLEEKFIMEPNPEEDSSENTD
ncbi:hypothetical protein ACS0TY_000784 [Phlomoides rotata]